MRAMTMSARQIGTILALAGCAVVSACSAASLVSDGPEDRLGILTFYGDSARISAPDTVARGASFTVTFSTFAGGCVRSVARDDVASTANVVEIRPYDHSTGGHVCTADLLYLQHSVAVRLDTPGRYLIRVIGQQHGTPPGGTTGSAELTRALTIR